ncbi:MAG TPA: hypothetical protein VLD35_10635 [Caldimonas sp.]|nr:hypothetical protein [Caldimonas sp.]
MNITVACLRSLSPMPRGGEAAPAATRYVPHDPQKSASSRLGVAHDGQRTMSGCPQCRHASSPGEASVSQFVQRIGTGSARER